MRAAFLLSLLAVLKRRFVFALVFPPMTITPSVCEQSSARLSCRSCVAGQIELMIFAPGKRDDSSFLRRSNVSMLKVVCESRTIFVLCERTPALSS